MLKGRIRGIYLRGEIYWFGKQVNGRRSVVSLETRDYAEAVERAREIVERPEPQPAQALTAEIDDVRVVQRHYAKLRPDDREMMKAFRV